MPQVLIRLLVTAVIGFVWQTGWAERFAWADPPRINSLSPAGVQRGTTTEVVVTGANLGDNPLWLGSLGMMAEGVAGSDPTSWRVRITPDPDVAVGVYVVRVQTDGGLSNPFPLAIDQVPRIVEVEDNSAFGSAQRVEGPVVVEGQASGSDVDFFRFSGRKGERVVIDAQCARVGSGVDPSIRLSTAGRRFLAGEDDTPGLLTDARLFAELPADGEYVVELSDTRYQGTGPRTNYRLLIGPSVLAAATVFPLGGRRGESVRFELTGGTLPGPGPLVAELPLNAMVAIEPGWVLPRFDDVALGLADPVPTGGWGSRVVDWLGPLAIGDFPEYREPTDPTAAPISTAIPAVFNGRIEAPGDSDSFLVQVTPGQKLQIKVDAAALGSRLDGVLQVRGKGGSVLANNDDSALPGQPRRRRGAAAAANKKAPILSLDPELIVNVPGDSTELTVTLRDLNGDGGPNYPYRLTIEPSRPGFDLAVTSGDQVNIPRGGTASIGVEADRQDFDGPITVTIADLPPGVTVRPGLIPPGQTVGACTVSASSDASFAATTLDLRGEATGPSGSILVQATRATIVASQADFATMVVNQTGLLGAPAAPLPITLTTPDQPVEMVLAYNASVPVHAVRSPGAEDVVLTFGSLPTVPNLAVAPDPKLGAKVLDGSIIVNTNPDLPPGPLVIAFNAKGKFGDRERTIALPAVAFNVVRPADIGVVPPRVEVAAGGSVEAVGTLVRRGPFREPVTVKLDGLPAGLKADPVIVPPESTEFRIKITADGQAKLAEAPAQLALTYKLGPRDYASPPSSLVIKVVPAP